MDVRQLLHVHVSFFVPILRVIKPKYERVTPYTVCHSRTERDDGYTRENGRVERASIDTIQGGQAKGVHVTGRQHAKFNCVFISHRFFWDKHGTLSPYTPSSSTSSMFPTQYTLVTRNSVKLPTTKKGENANYTTNPPTVSSFSLFTILKVTRRIRKDDNHQCTKRRMK